MNTEKLKEIKDKYLRENLYTRNDIYEQIQIETAKAVIEEIEKWCEELWIDNAGCDRQQLAFNDAINRIEEQLTELKKKLNGRR